MDIEELRRLAAIGREVEWEIEFYGDPYLMGIVARVRAGDGFTQVVYEPHLFDQDQLEDGT